MKNMKVLVALMLAMAMVLAIAAASALTLEPDDTEVERLAGATFHATVGAFDEETQTFTLTVYDYDRYDRKDTAMLEVGDKLLAGGRIHLITGQEMLDETLIFKTGDGEEIYFDKAYDDDDDLIARSTDDDRIFMHVVNVVHLPAAEGVVLLDDSDPEGPTVTITSLADILKVQAEKEETSIGLNYYATTVTLNRDLEITQIHVAFDVAQ